jgi:hypothetical protein
MRTASILKLAGRYDGKREPSLRGTEPRSPGVISPSASAEETAFIARETSWADGPHVFPTRPRCDNG